MLWSTCAARAGSCPRRLPGLIETVQRIENKTKNRSNYLPTSGQHDLICLIISPNKDSFVDLSAHRFTRGDNNCHRTLLIGRNPTCARFDAHSTESSERCIRSFLPGGRRRRRRRISLMNGRPQNKEICDGPKTH